MKPVGKYIDRFNALTGQRIPCGDIYQSSGLYKHVMKRHPDCIDDLDSIPRIIAAPDYVGKNPREPQSIELVKRLNGNIMVCIKFDVKANHLYVASLFKTAKPSL